MNNTLTKEVEGNKKLIKAILDTPQKHEGLLKRLADKDKALCKYYGLEDRFRQGFLFAEEIVKEWAKEVYPLKNNNQVNIDKK